MRDCQFSRGLGTISTIVLSFFIWTFGGVFEVAYAIKSDQQSAPGGQRTKGSDQRPKPGTQTPSEKRHEEKFSKDMDDLEGILKDDKPDHETKKQKIKGKKAEIDADDVEIKKQFKDTEDKIKDFPEVIKQRHRDFVKSYDKNMNELKANLDTIDKAKTKKETDAAIEKTNAHLKKTKPPKKHKPLDPHKLPQRTSDSVEVPLEELTPSQAKALEREYAEAEKYALSSAVSEPKGIQVASIASLAGLLTSTVLQTTPPPIPADLAETIEVKFTPAINAKAAELNHNPVKIYEYVRNNIEYVPTYGSIQGADMCLQTKLCNDMDTASLLIALLRVSGIHAKYATGTIQLPIEKVKNWVGGFTDSMEALRLLASAGVPTKGLTEGGQIKYVQMEHVWVEAYIDYIPSRGSRHKNGQGDTWIRLDASFKQYSYKEPIDFTQVLGFDAAAFVDEILAGSNVDPVNSSISNVPQDLILQRSQEYVQSVHQYYDANLQNKTTEDIVGSKKIVVQEFPYLLGTLPYKRVAVGNKYSEIPDSFRWRINFQIFNSIYSIDPDFSYTASTAALAGKSITLSYRPSTSNDESLVQRYGYIEKVPPYLLNLIPELTVDGEAKASAAPVSSGRDIDFIMTFISPKGSQDIIRNQETAGAFLGIGLDLGYLSKILLDNKIAEWSRLHDDPSATNYRKTETVLSLLSDVYFAELDAVNIIGTRFAKVVDVRLPSAAIIGEDLKINYVFGSPLTLSFAGLVIDVDRDIHATFAKDGDKDKAVTFNIFSGNNGSAMEHALWEHLYRVPGVSTLKTLKSSNEFGGTCYKIDSSNLAVTLPLLQVSADVKSDISNAVNAGKSVYISGSNMQYYDWNGTGYIVMDEKTAAAGYIINGLSGGADARDEKWWDCVESVFQVFDLIPYSSILLGVAMDHVAFALSLSDTGRTTDTSLTTKGQASLCSYISLIVSTAALHPRLGKSVGIVMAVTFVEVILWASAYRLNEGKWPILQENPLQDCADIYTDIL